MSSMRLRDSPWDHPRACGEHLADSSHSDSLMGSSPRLRGTHVDGFPVVFDRGIIPALAGNTAKPRRSWSYSWDHPRACGEHSVSVSNADRFRGSSPRLRGTLAGLLLIRQNLGIIPALAGNTRRFGRRLWGWRDHPRACGEHSMQETVGALSLGSSPRLRGTLVGVQPAVPHGGIIPALAGNTRSRQVRCRRTRDHPRACGEHMSPAVSYSAR